MKTLILGQNTKDIEELISSFGFEVVSKNPDLIISFGGDGTLLSLERQYPSVPKLPIRNSVVCKKCISHTDEVVLKKLKEGELKLTEYRKLKQKSS